MPHYATMHVEVIMQLLGNHATLGDQVNLY